MAEVIVVSLVLFFAATLFEIGGGYLIWLWLRENKRRLFGFLGAVSLFIYAIILGLQSADFGRVYAAYGGIFIASSIVWGLIIDKKKPDRYEIIGACIALIGAAIIMYAPR